MINKKIINYYNPNDEVLKSSENSYYNPLGLNGITGITMKKYSQKKVCSQDHRFVSYIDTLDSFP